MKSITINFFEYTAQRVNPSLSNDLTEAIRTQFRKMTSLEQVDMDGDMEISGAITGLCGHRQRGRGPEPPDHLDQTGIHQPEVSRG